VGNGSERKEIEITVLAREIVKECREMHCCVGRDLPNHGR